MSPRIAVLGAGRMGAVAARLLAEDPSVELLVLDADGDLAARVAGEAGRGEADTARVGHPSLVRALEGVDAVAACLPYRLNRRVMEATLEASCGYADLGGLFHETRRQLELDPAFRRAGVAAILGIGAAPGVTNLLASAAASRLDEVRAIEVLGGGVDEAAAFGVPYSPETLLDEFTLPAVVYEAGEYRQVPAGSDPVRYVFPAPIGEQEAVLTLHSEAATLPRTIPGVEDVRWRLALPAEVVRGFRLLLDLGLGSDETVETSAGPATPRDVLVASLARLPSPPGPPRDRRAHVARVEGRRGGTEATVTATAVTVARGDLSAGALATALPIVLAVRRLAAGEVEAGVHAPEEALAAEPFLAALADAGIEVEIEGSPPRAA